MMRRILDWGIDKVLIIMVITVGAVAMLFGMDPLHPVEVDRVDGVEGDWYDQ